MKKLALILLTLLSSLIMVAQNQVNLGDLKLNQPIDQRSDIQNFYKEVLEVKLVSFEEPVARDYIQFDNGFRVNLIYTDASNALTALDFEKAIWIKITVSDYDGKVKRIKKSAADVLKEKIGSELYFQAPGGQIFRMVKAE